MTVMGIIILNFLTSFWENFSNKFMQFFTVNTPMFIKKKKIEQCQYNDNPFSEIHSG